MPYAYKQIELQKMEWCSRDTLYNHIDRFVPIYIPRGKRTLKRFLTREDSLIYKAWLDATRPQRCSAFCRTAFDDEYTGEIPATILSIVAHYNDGRIFDKIYYNWEEVEKVHKIAGLRTILTQLRLKCFPPLDDTKKYIQAFGDKELELFNVSLRKWKKRGYRKGSRIIIDWFGRKQR